MRAPRSVLTAVLVLTLPTLLAGKCRKDPEIIEPTDPVEVVDAPSAAVALQVVSVSPSRMPAGVEKPAKVYGAGFLDGVRVKVGTRPPTSIDRTDPNTLSITVPALSEGAYDLVVTNPDGASATLRQAIEVMAEVDTSCRRMAMYFELDQSTLSPDARRVLDDAMPCLSEQNQIRLEGHADERGTTDYNVALGQRRAESVQSYLVGRGLPQRSLPVISYGEERPADPASTEVAWAKNRRVELVAQ